MRKRCLLILLFLAVLTASSFAVIGDVNGDNQVNIIDALIIAQYYVGQAPQNFIIAASDVNVDGKTDIVDALMIARYTVGLITEFPAGNPNVPGTGIAVFTTEQELIDAFMQTLTNYSGYWLGAAQVFRTGMTPSPNVTRTVMTGGTPMSTPVPTMGATNAPGGSTAPSAGPTDYSQTNTQVQGVDEADIIKTDGNYIYMLSRGKLIIADSYPATAASIISQTALTGITPLEMFVHDNRLMIYGQVSYVFQGMYPTPPPSTYTGYYYIYNPSTPFVAVRLYDITDRTQPVLVRNVEIEGQYLSSRKIRETTYFVVNTYPYYVMTAPAWQDIIPMYRDVRNVNIPVAADMTPVCTYDNVWYIKPVQAQRFVTVASLNMLDETAPVKRQVIVGSGQEIFSSLENLYIVQTVWPPYTTGTSYTERTVVNKFAVDSGNIQFAASGEVKGYTLNQFSMDEYNGYFRIATTIRRVSPVTNNLYILDSQMKQTGALENMAPGEQIYSVRFAGNKAYLVTFEKIDPFFVVELSNPKDPFILGELKIPGYSDYLHPIDENHIIGLGKHTVESDSGNFSWYQGLKLAVFDVTNPTNPLQMFQEVIGHRGTDSEALREHKAFLYSADKNLLVIPVNLAEFTAEPASDSQIAPCTFQGAYVYELTLQTGFNLRGRITHNDSPVIASSGGIVPDSNRNIRRSLYIEDTLYTFSNSRLQSNNLATLDKIKALEF